MAGRGGASSSGASSSSTSSSSSSSGPGLASQPQWRRFQFFEKDEVRLRDPTGVLGGGSNSMGSSDDLTGTASFGQPTMSPSLSASGDGSSASGAFALDQIVVTSAASTRSWLCLGDADGYLNLFDRRLSLIGYFQAYPRGRPVSLVRTVGQSQGDYHIVVTVGDDDPEALDPTVKIWRISRDGVGQIQPIPLRVIRLNTVSQVVPVTCLAVREDLTELAVGLANGLVVLMRGKLANPDEQGSGAQGIRQVTLEGDAEGNPVTALHFREEALMVGNSHQFRNDEDGPPPRVLYVATSATVTVFVKETPDSKEIFQEVLDDMDGCGIGSSTMSDTQELVIGRSSPPMEAVYFYGTEGRGSTFALEGDKQLLEWFRGYLIVTGNQRSGMIASQAHAGAKYNSFTIYDLKNKFVAYSENRFQNVTHVVCEWNTVFVICGGGKIWRLEEKDTQTKLDTLFRKNLYEVAINLARSQDVFDPSMVVDIYRRYGDYLYSRGPDYYDAAMDEYIKTIGALEPSYVIRKFLDAQRIYNLTKYLQALHEQPSSNVLVKPDHTTLLFNCYTQLKDEERLREFIAKENLQFDIDTAIRACRQAGYFENALFLAKKHRAHDWHGKILLEDMSAYDEALDYISSLEVLEAEELFQRHAKHLMEHRPERTTQLLEALCGCEGGWPTVARGAPRLRSKPNDFIHNFVDKPRWLQKFLETITTAWQLGGLEAFEETTSLEAFDDMDLMLRGVDRPVKQRNPEGVIWNTLLELYLRRDDGHNVHKQQQDAQAGSKNATGASVVDEHLTLSEEERMQNWQSALDLLQNPGAQYDEEHALFLCKLNNFKDGLLYLYERMSLFSEILQYFVEHDTGSEGAKGADGPGFSAQGRENIMRTCKRFGDEDPQLWLTALGHFATYPDSCHQEILEVLQSIDRDNLLPPLAVVQILATKPRAPLSLVRDYIGRRLTLEADVIAENQRVIRNFQDETKKMRAELAELKGRAKIFQLNKCTYCSMGLDLPAVHFLCMHSFHQRCLPENEGECPVCAPQNKKILEIKRSLAEAQHQHELFFRQLEGSADGFKTVADYFGRGLFDAPTPAPAAANQVPVPRGAAPPGQQELPPMQQFNF